jgi:RNA polymerase sigma factor (sigma-70 family)
MFFPGKIGKDFAIFLGMGGGGVSWRRLDYRARHVKGAYNDQSLFSPRPRQRGNAPGLASPCRLHRLPSFTLIARGDVLRLFAGMTGWLSSSAGGHLAFETTQWSLVSAAAENEQSRVALEALYRSYSSPVYAFIRRRGYNRQDAQDLTQDFFIHLVEKNAFRRADPNRGKFRRFLSGSLEFFLQHAAERARTEKRGGQAKIVFLDDETAEAGYQLTDPGQTAEQIFDARWVSALTEGALSRLQTEMAETGKETLYEQISGFLLEDEERSYLEVAQRAGLTIPALRMAIHRLRGRYRELLRAEVARTVTSSADFDDEIRALRASLLARRSRG